MKSSLHKHGSQYISGELSCQVVLHKMKMVRRCSLILVLVLFTVSISAEASRKGNPYYTSSRATYYSTSDGLGTASGACGYGEFGRKIYGGNVAGVAGLYRNGAGCGACYQVKCTDKALCSASGVTVVATDYGQGDKTDFIMSHHAFSQLSTDDAAGKELFAKGTVDILYRRVACKYSGYNMMIKIDKNSNNPSYLAFTFVYVGGAKDIVGVEIYDQVKGTWTAMSRSYEAVWSIAGPPKGELKLRVKVSQDASSSDLVNLRKPIPAAWHPGQYYDTGIQFY